LRRIFLVVLVAFGLWLLAAVVTGLYFAADGGHGGKPSVILVAAAMGVIVLGLDAMLIRRLWGAGRRPG
jgi:hypothetical protein